MADLPFWWTADPNKTLLEYPVVGSGEPAAPAPPFPDNRTGTVPAYTGGTTGNDRQSWTLRVRTPLSAYLRQVSVRVNEDVEDATTVLQGPVYVEIWLKRMSGQALMLSQGYMLGGYDQYRSIVGGVGVVHYATGDKLYAFLSNASATAVAYRVDVEAVETLQEIADNWNEISTNRSPTQAPRSQGMSLGDQRPYDLTLTMARRLAVDAESPWWDGLNPTGRYLYKSDFNKAVLDWTTVDGTVTRDTTFPNLVESAGVLKFVSAATANLFCRASKYFLLPADQGFNQSTEMAISAWINVPTTTNLYRWDIQFALNDLTAQKWTGKISVYGSDAFSQYTYAGGDSADLSGTYARIRTLDATNGQWHLFSVVLAYKQGADGTGYLKYRNARFDDRLIGVYTGGAKPGWAYPSNVISTVQFLQLQIGHQNDTAATAVTSYCAGVVVKDLSNGYGV